MKTFLEEDAGFIRQLFDAIPLYLFIVDTDMRIQKYNKAAEKLVGSDSELVLKRRGGEVFRCIHEADSPEGCGHGMHCQTCVMRSAASEAFEGNNVVRRRAKMELLGPNGQTDFYALITVSTFLYEGQPMAILVIEDINQVIELQQLIPVCSKCKKVRADKNYWTQLELYVKDHLGAEFTHGYCPECFNEVMASITKEDKTKK